MRPYAIEGDFIETIDRFIFDVKGLVHPPDRVIAFLRYVPACEGSRVKRGSLIRYTKIYDLGARYRYLKSHASVYLYNDPMIRKTVQAVPISRIKKLYKPNEKLSVLMRSQSLDIVQRDAVDLVKLLHKRTGIPLKALGITGSVLVDLHLEHSDIDLVVYGKNRGRILTKALPLMTQNPESEFKRYTGKSILPLMRHRWGSLPRFYNALLEIELQKSLQGVYRNRDVFIRVVPSHLEIQHIYGQYKSRPLGRICLTGKLIDDSESYVTPCRYLLSVLACHVGSIPADKIEVLSFRGRFTEQGKKGDIVRVLGSAELVQSPTKRFYRLILGGSKEDFMLPEHLFSDK
ncbi:MAG: hypothetical protein ACTSVM_02560 [Candidatus Ranarchaeia archaeon]